jgi:threonine dehydratase
MHLTAEMLRAAQDVVYRHMTATPQYAWPLLAGALGAEVWVKHENATPIGAFKVRGGLVYVDRLRRERPHVKGIVSATRGNHGQSLAYAGRAYQLPVVIVVPERNSIEKNAAMKAFGAELVIEGRDFQAAREHSVALAEQRGFEVVPPFHPDLAAGVATYAHELFDAVADLDTVYVPVGMGSGINGVIGVRDLLGLRTEIVGVVADNAPATALSHRARTAINTDEAATFVDGVACRQPDPASLESMYDGAARIITVSEEAVASAMRVMFCSTHHLPEPAGAIALAGLVAEREQQRGKRVAVILTGANMDTAMAAEVLSGATPSP